MFKILDGRNEFYQWDQNRKIIVSDSTVKEVHFANCLCSTAKVVETYMDGAVTLADVPNVLLTEYQDIKVWGFDGEATKHCATFEVVKRTKPDDYVYTEEEFWTVEKAVEEAIQEAKENGEFGGSNTLIVRLDYDTELASHTPAEIYELYKQGTTIVLNTGDEEYTVPYALTYCDDYIATFSQVNDTPEAAFYYIAEDGTFDSYFYTLADGAHAYPFIVGIWNDDETVSATAAEIAEAATNGCVVFLDKHQDDSVLRYMLSFASPDSSSFYQISDDGFVYGIDVDSEGKYTEYERKLVFDDYLEDVYKDEIVQAVIDALPVYNGEVI